MNIKCKLADAQSESMGLRFHDMDVELENIRAVMINEVVPPYPEQDFYGGGQAGYLETSIPLFQNAGADIRGSDDILDLGIYITNAIKLPKTESKVSREQIEKSLPYLEKELSLFPNVKVVMLMGDAAIKAFNMISKNASGRNAVPGISTYKLRKSEIYYEGIRIMPSYIMTGKNILIEKSKAEMAAEDISEMLRIIG